MPMTKTPHTPKPPWLKKRLSTDPAFESVRNLMRRNRLHTVCEEAGCPNIWECYSRRTATFMILGDHCSRDCLFCAVSHGPLSPPDPEEPHRVAAAIALLEMDYAVITSVTRDDLSDYGAGHFVETLKAIRALESHCLVELLIPDFMGDPEALRKVVAAEPDVLNHNLETVPRLYHSVRPQASYSRSLHLLRQARAFAPGLPIKSGIMLGFGESENEIQTALQDLLAVDCRILSLGQYLQPAPSRLKVARYLPPEEFEAWRKRALQMGFAQVAAGPFVRSSYKAKTIYENLNPKKSRIRK